MRKHARLAEPAPDEGNTETGVLETGDATETAATLGEDAPGEDRSGEGALGEVAALGERFAFQEKIGYGGMGSVYRAVDHELQRNLAVKVLNVKGNRGRRLRPFRQEAQITGQLDHPNIPPIHDFGIDDNGLPYMMMKLVHGESLQAAVDRAGEGRLRPKQLERLLVILTKVCDAVSFAHSRGVVHRDIKPANIMSGDFGQIYLMDWGLAMRLRRAAASEPPVPAPKKPRRMQLAGTPSYMAPEQASGRVDAIDELTDVFQLGATLYYILTGRPPYVGERLQELVDQAIQAQFPAPSELAGTRLPAGLSKIAVKAMARDPGDRHLSASDFQKDLEQFLRGSWHLPTKRFRSGECIIREGDLGDSAYIIVEGTCVVFRSSGGDRVFLREMGPGDAFGETGVVSNKPRTASVEALDEVIAMVVTRAALTEGLGISSWVGSFVVGLAERFRDLSDRLQELEDRPPDD